MVRFVLGFLLGAVIGFGVWATSGVVESGKLGAALVLGFGLLAGGSSVYYGDRFWSKDGDCSWWRFF